MAYTFEIDARNHIVRVQVTGVDTPADVEQRIREVTNDLRWSPGMNVIVDYSGATRSEISPDYLAKVATVHSMLRAFLGDGRLAIVAGEETAAGFTRMWDAYVQGRSSMQIRVCRDVKEAEAWLGLPPAGGG